jgi:hypothetical protein
MRPTEKRRESVEPWPFGHRALGPRGSVVRAALPRACAARRVASHRPRAGAWTGGRSKRGCLAKSNVAKTARKPPAWSGASKEGAKPSPQDCLGRAFRHGFASLLPCSLHGR